MMWRTIFSVCGKLGHFPVCGWLCMAKAYMKCCTNKVTTSLDDKTNDMLVEILARVQWDDSVGGDWCVNRCEFTVWVDTSSLATGGYADSQQISH